MLNQRDHHFKELMAERSFFELLMKTYLPAGLLSRIDWKSIELYKMGGKHLEENTGKEFESDVIYLAQLSGKDSFLWLHSGYQSNSDRMMPLRIMNYQTAELLFYAKQNPEKDLPGVITLIYHQGEKPWRHSLQLKDLFVYPELAMKYFGNPILIDLPSISDEELKRHQNIGPIEVIMKYMRQKDFESNMRVVLSELRTVDDRTRRIALKYAINFIEDCGNEFPKIIEECLPNDKDMIMTLTEGWTKEGVQKGLFDVAHTMLAKGFDDKTVQEITQLSAEAISDLRNGITY